MNSSNRSQVPTTRDQGTLPRRLRKAAPFYLWRKAKSVGKKLLVLWLLVVGLKCLVAFWPFVVVLLRPVFHVLRRLFDLSL